MFEFLRVAITLEACPIGGDVHFFEIHPQGLEGAGQVLTRYLDVMQPTAVGDEHLAFGNRGEDVSDTSPDGHRVAVPVETVGSFHSTLGKNDDHDVFSDPVQNRLPGVIRLTGDRQHVRGQQPEEPTYKGSIDGLLGDWHHGMPRDSPQEAEWDPACIQPFEKACVIEHREHLVGPPWVLGNGLDPTKIEVVEDPGTDPDQEEDREIEDPSHVRESSSGQSIGVSAVDKALPKPVVESRKFLTSRS